MSEPGEPLPPPAVSDDAAPAAAGEEPPSLERKEELLPVVEKISELDESQSKLLDRLRGLKEDLLNWRNNLDTQVTKYKTELSDIKTALNSEIEELRSDFQELRTTLKKQQEDVSNSLKNLGLQDTSDNDGNKESGEGNASEGVSATPGNLKETTDEDSTVDETAKVETASDE
ncbi:hypothetical protein GUJ93_ZPchr0012g20254 [Zizania palustris]|uniref:Uncharacterized protein n=1 Tax=Zizania palustris TaxID=103762 RepID=A0A8J5WNM1_ZIZPA|nr:hypothetical protein GUJ93_ZPchr0012g20254 [Zizania palustris]